MTYTPFASQDDAQKRFHDPQPLTIDELQAASQFAYRIPEWQGRFNMELVRQQVTAVDRMNSSSTRFAVIAICVSVASVLTSMVSLIVTLNHR